MNSLEQWFYEGLRWPPAIFFPRKCCLTLKSNSQIFRACFFNQVILFWYINVHKATRWTIKHGLMLLWFKDLISECNREVIIHRPNVSTLLSSAFIRDDLIAATRCPSICSLISCPFFWRGVNRPQVVSCHHQEGGDNMPGFRKKRW